MSDDLGEINSNEISQIDKTPEEPKKSKKEHAKKVAIIASLVILGIIIGGASVYWYSSQQSIKPKNTATKPIQKKAIKPVSDDDPILKKFITPTTGETWLPQPKQIAKQGYLSASYEESTDYYEVGKRADRTIIMTATEMLGDTIHLFEKAPDSTVVMILRPDSQITYNQEEESQDDLIQTSRANIKADRTIHYDSLSPPKTLKVDKNYFVLKSEYPDLGDRVSSGYAPTGQTVTDVSTLGSSKLQKAELQYADTGLTSISYSLINPLKNRVHFGFEPLEPTLDRYSWSKGHSGVSDTIKNITRGCGGRTASITRSEVLKDSDVQVVGKSPSGLVVYELVDQNNPLLTKAYEEFKEYSGIDQNVPYSSISKEEFIKQHGLVLYKDKNGQWLVYTRVDLSPGYGCAKPVVYLYPTKEQAVSVKVGADVKISDPFYDPSNGWDVIAKPNGQLTVNGSTYGSLFWEGPGIGSYPAITSGTIVKRDKAIATIKLQLAQQGLNQTEIKDFVEYWQDKLPAKPYVRLTWLNTNQMNELAPLRINPKPTTVIRVFLDFSGLDKPIKLAPQKFTKPVRSGFTVVEWGGLNPKKLY